MGDPHGIVPDFVTEAMADSAASFGNYPAITGTEDWRKAAAGWLNRRFGLNGAIDPEKNVLPLNGTREGLFSALFPLMPLKPRHGERPIVAMPNPFYQCYAAAALGRRRRAALCRRRLRRTAFCPISPACRSDAGAAGRGLYLLALQSRRRGGGRGLLAKNCSRWPSAMISSCWRMNAMPTSISASCRSVRCRRGKPQSGGFTRLLSFHSLSKRRACRACAPAWWRAMPR